MAFPASSLWVVRHAPVAVRGICYGQSEVPVTIPADDAARRVSAALRAAAAGTDRALPLGEMPRFDAVVTSPSERAWAPAARFAELVALPLRIDPRLYELSFGEWEGHSFADLEKSDGVRFSAWMADYMRVAPPGGETAQELMDRVAQFAKEIAASDQRVLAFAHAGVIRALRVLVRGVPFSELALERVEYLAPEPVPLSSLAAASNRASR